ncbi:MAG: nucleoside triphosphate pyrophosphohydrolase [Cycloclasticus sp.]|jgi:ATP diphosphatase|nr:nucleoside triphosphate pyrophosphohydrolase [Cycloclasticus sp.]MEE4290851.1 nucleoside triphosphate pyrophosphohydrolase [Cycloclasticus sp.]
MNNPANNKVKELLDIMAQLRDRKNGCPWDLEQDFASIAPYTIEEAYEVADAIERKNLHALKDELGDLLFQVVFHAQLAKEQQAFEFADIVASICDKLTRRHPHVFDESFIGKGNLSKQWEAHKRAEQKGSDLKGVLDGVSKNQPAMNQAYKLQKKAASVGFDWPDVEGVLAKLDEEVDELKAEIGVANNSQRIEEELGDVLFSCINLARHLNVNPEWSLRLANQRFSNRFSHIEERLKESGKNIENCSLSTLDALWDEAKVATKKAET